MFHIFLNWGFPGGSDGKESICNTGDLGSIPGSGRSPGEGNGYPLQCSCLENSMDRGAWRTTVHGITKRQTQLRDFTFFPLSRDYKIWWTLYVPRKNRKWSKSDFILKRTTKMKNNLTNFVRASMNACYFDFLKVLEEISLRCKLLCPRSRIIKSLSSWIQLIAFCL